jgi:acetate---CoA ligase (ADP-forming)
MTALTERSASLQSFFTPRGVAVIGASRDPGKLSYGVMRNLLDPVHRYPGPVYPVNPRATDVLGLPCYPDIRAVPDPVELAVLLVPAALVAGTIEACGQRGLKAAVVISGGFREIGPEGAAREREMVEIARRYGMRVMGPNGIGVIDTHTPLNTTFVKGMPARGSIAFLSQSGALCGGIIDWALARGLGFSRFLSVGNEADVNETDIIPFLAADNISRVIALYLEDVKGGPAFVAALRDAARRKPVLAIKTGRTAGGQAATASHTGALAGVHAAFRAACKQAGVIEVESIQALFDGALALAYQPLPAGGRIAILTNAGGPAALAADVLEGAGLQLARTSPETQAALRGCLHGEAQVAGPVDMLGGADHADYRQAVDAVLADPANDGILAILVPQVLVDPVAVVDALAAGLSAASVGGSGAPRKPLLACLMGAACLDAAFAAAHRAQIPAYTFPEDAVAAFGILRRRAMEDAKAAARADAAAGLPATGRAPDGGRAAEAQRLLSGAAAAGRTTLDAAESRAVLDAFGLTTPADLLATSPDQAAEHARRIGFPVALKLASPDILHKTDVGGVILGVTDEAGARQGFETILARARAAHPDARIRGVQVQRMIAGGQEVIVGVKRDPTFGPLVMFGLGGVYVEALADVSFRLAPLTPADADEMIDEVRSARLLAGLRGARPADRAALIEAIVRIGDLAAACPQIAELDVNPLLVLPEGQGALALDARIILS